MIVGQCGSLICDYNEENIQMLSQKCYLDIFYLWRSQDLPTKIHPSQQSGFRINVAKSRNGMVKIQNVTLSAAGKLRYEV